MRTARWSRLVAHTRRLAVGALVALAPAAPASADLVTLATGRTVAVASIRAEAGEAILTLRGGGEIRCPLALVVAVAPDELPVAASEVAEVASTGPVLPPPDLSSRPYAPLIADLASRHGLELRLVHAVVAVESGYAPRARSRAGARGLMQVMPATGRQYGSGNLYEPRHNLDAGMRHLKGLLARFDVSLALAAYNAGEAAVRRFGGIPPYPETQDYVRRVLALAGLSVAAMAPGAEPGASPFGR